MKFGIVTFPGSNCDYDAYPRGRSTCSARRPCTSGTRTTTSQGADVVILPGGFSYGDYLRAGAIARFSPIMHEVVAHADAAARCSASATASRSRARPGCCRARCCATRACSSSASRCTCASRTPTRGSRSATSRARSSRIPIAHGDGRYTADDDDARRLEGDGPRRLPLRRRRRRRRSTRANPNGSSRAIAGIVNDRGNVLGMMPHPERAVEPLRRLRRRPRAVRVRARRASASDRADIASLNLSPLPWPPKKSRVATRTSTSRKLNAELIKERRAPLDAERAQTRAQVALHEVPEVRRRPEGARAPPRRRSTQCTDCNGVWLDAGELELLERAQREPRRRSFFGSLFGTGRVTRDRPPRPGDPAITPALVAEHGLTPDEYERLVDDARPHADVHRARHRQRAVERALLVQALAPAAQDAADEGAVGAAGPRRERRRHLRSATGSRSRSRSSRTTTRRPSSRTRARRPASAASCATCSRWARARSRCSTRCASGRSTSPRVRYLFAGVVKGIGDYGNCVGIPTVAGEVVFDPAYEGNPLVNAMCVGADARGGADSRRWPRASATRSSRSARARDATASTARRSRPRTCRSESDAKRPRVQVGDPFTEKLLLEAIARADPQRPHRRHPGHGRRRPHVVVRRDGGARRRRRHDRRRRRCRCAKRA